MLDSLAIPLVVLSNRYERAIEAVCFEVPYRYGLVMQFIRAQSKANAQHLAGEELSSTGEEKEAREAWISEGLSMDSYRSFALQIFQLRQERDPPFILMVFRHVPEKMVVVWFRDIHLVNGPFYKGLLPAVEHVYVYIFFF